MSKRVMAVVVFVGTLGAYLAYRASGAEDVSGLWEWLRSIATRASLKINSFIEDFMTGDDTQKAVTKALDFIASKEGFSSRAYADPPGQSTKFSIGYGHQITGSDGLSTTSVIDESEGFELLSQDVQTSVNDVLDSVNVDLNVNQLAALISFRYNVGSGNFSSSTLLRLINAGDFDGAAAEFPKWIYANGQVNSGLVSRREAEQNLFQEA